MCAGKLMFTLRFYSSERLFLMKFREPLTVMFKYLLNFLVVSLVKRKCLWHWFLRKIGFNEKAYLDAIVSLSFDDQSSQLVDLNSLVSILRMVQSLSINFIDRFPNTYQRDWSALQGRKAISLHANPPPAPKLPQPNESRPYRWLHSQLPPCTLIKCSTRWWTLFVLETSIEMWKHN